MATPTPAPIPTPSTPPSPVPSKWQAYEAWAAKSLALLLSALYVSGVIPTSGTTAKLAGVAATVLVYLGYTVNRTAAQKLVSLLLFAFLMHGSGCTPNTRNTTIQASLTATNAGAAALASYDAQHQQDIITNAKDKASGETALQAWRTERTTLALVFDSAYRAIALAATANDAQSLTAMLNAVAIVSQELAQLGVKIP